ncbi:NmrA family NAD(P)-binding protein [Sphingomonadaceae bacterium OTU29LAMAA1]|nr:NmrA family NAD(P)-binding protein [Sphingomonadaceae bacterium OTU29LAMAA1]
MSRDGFSKGRPRIVVAGATGRVGAALMARLADDPVEVLGLSRSASNCRLSPAPPIAQIDFDRPASLSVALEGADRLFLAHGTSDRQVENEIAMIDAAVRAGVSHIVKLSAMGPPTRLHPFDWHMKIEAHLADCDIGYTVLRPSCFVDVLARAKAPVASGTWGGTAEDGRVNLIDTRDVADVARVALLDERFLDSQRAYHLTGPGTVSMPEIAEELSQLLGRPVNYAQRTRAEHREILVASGVSEMVADLLLGLDRIFRDGVLAETTKTVSDLTGKDARPVSGWLSDNRAAFGPSAEAAA